MLKQQKDKRGHQEDRPCDAVADLDVFEVIRIVSILLNFLDRNPNEGSEDQ